MNAGPIRTVILCCATATLVFTGVAQANAKEVSKLYVNTQSSTVDAAASLDGQAKADALAHAEITSATWFTQGSPDETNKKVAEFVGLAAASASAGQVVRNPPFMVEAR